MLNFVMQLLVTPPLHYVWNSCNSRQTGKLWKQISGSRGMWLWNSDSFL